MHEQFFSVEDERPLSKEDCMVAWLFKSLQGVQALQVFVTRFRLSESNVIAPREFYQTHEIDGTVYSCANQWTLKYTKFWSRED